VQGVVVEYKGTSTEYISKHTVAMWQDINQVPSYLVFLRLLWLVSLCVSKNKWDRYEVQVMRRLWLRDDVGMVGMMCMAFQM
jgi:hypothetical protein